MASSNDTARMMAIKGKLTPRCLWATIGPGIFWTTFM
jgi:hypothetical protein